MNETLAFPVALGVRIASNLGLLFMHPLAMALAELSLDALDFTAWTALAQPMTRDTYNTWDKAGDLSYHLAGLAWAVWLAPGLWWARYLIPLALWRIVGDVLFCVTKRYAYLVIFPDFFSLALLVFGLIDALHLAPALRRRPTLFRVLILVGALEKFAEEYYHHIVRADADIVRIEDGYSAVVSVLLALWTLAPGLVAAIWLGSVLQPDFTPGAAGRRRNGLFTLHVPWGLAWFGDSEPVARLTRADAERCSRANARTQESTQSTHPANPWLNETYRIA